MKQLIKSAALVFGLFAGQSAFAGIPVIDGVSNGMRVAEFAQTVVQWGKEISEMQMQYQQMLTDYEQMQATHASMNGTRNWANANKNDYGQVSGDWQNVMQNTDYSEMLEASKLVDADEASFSSTSDAAISMRNSQNQNALNRTVNESTYNAITQRLANLKNLAAQVNATPDAKDTADLQARIQSEQALLQNEQNKVAMLAQLQQNQRDIQDQRSREMLIKMSKLRDVKMAE